MQRRLITLLALAAALVVAAPAATAKPDRPPTPSERATLEQYAADTWRSFLMMVSPTTGLPSDKVSAEGVRSTFTSPTNIGAYIWSTIVARDIGLIKPNEARARIEQTLASTARLERHEESGQFYNWYNPDTGAKLLIWPEDGNPVYPFLSSVDNGWLAAALMVVKNAVPQLRDEADAILRDMDFGFYYNPREGQIRGGYWPQVPPNTVYAPTVDFSGACPNSGTGTVVSGFTCHHYGALNTEPRIASYIGIALGQIPPEHYYRMWRTFPNDCGWNWQEQRPEGVWRNYLGVDVFEGSYAYRGMRLVPTWGGSMFEALMVPLFVPEEDWAPRSWGINHPLYVQAQIEHGLEEADYGYWGFSPSNNPDGGYREYGVDPIGLEPNGYASDQERTHVDYGWPDPACPRPASIPTDYGRGVVTPHASFLALEYDREAALENLANLRRDFDVYGQGGFFDAVDVVTGKVSRWYLALDQGMIMAALGNELRNDRLRHYFTQGEVTQVVKPTIAPEEFTAGRG